jgi:hypothetical protein
VSKYPFSHLISSNIKGIKLLQFEQWGESEVLDTNGSIYHGDFNFTSCIIGLNSINILSSEFEQHISDFVVLISASSVVWVHFLIYILKITTVVTVPVQQLLLDLGQSYICHQLGAHNTIVQGRYKYI